MSQDQNKHWTLTLTNDLKDVPQLAVFVEEICEALSFDDMTTMQMNLAIEEAVVNVMDYAYPEGVEGYVEVEVWADEQTFVITDSGKPFDPTTKGDVDVTLSAEERQIGGLGIYLVRQMMDSIGYEYKDGHNVLTLKKKVKE